jgi:hypothetical protein
MVLPAWLIHPAIWSPRRRRTAAATGSAPPAAKYGAPSPIVLVVLVFPPAGQPRVEMRSARRTISQDATSLRTRTCVDVHLLQVDRQPNASDRLQGLHDSSSETTMPFPPHNGSLLLTTGTASPHAVAMPSPRSWSRRMSRHDVRVWNGCPCCGGTLHKRDERRHSRRRGIPGFVRQNVGIFRWKPGQGDLYYRHVDP